MQARRLLLPFLLTCAWLGPVGCRQANLIDSTLFMPDTDGGERRASLKAPHGVEQASAIQASAKPPAVPPPAPADTLKGLTLGAGTGGYEADHQPGDQALQVTLEPRDIAGRVVPVHGNLQIVAQQISPDGTRSNLCHWDIPAEELRQRWQTDRGKSGYLLVLPWKAWPAQEELHVVARLCVAGGKLLETDRDVRVRLAPTEAAHARPAPLPPVPGGVETASHARPTSVYEAVRLSRPVPLRDDE
jgi:hypothetical protein